MNYYIIERDGKNVCVKAIMEMPEARYYHNGEKNSQFPEHIERFNKHLASLPSIECPQDLPLGLLVGWSDEYQFKRFSDKYSFQWVSCTKLQYENHHPDFRRHIMVKDEGEKEPYQGNPFAMKVEDIKPKSATPPEQQGENGFIAKIESARHLGDILMRLERKHHSFLEMAAELLESYKLVPISASTSEEAGGMKVNELMIGVIKRIIDLQPAHIKPYNLGDEGEISSLITTLKQLLAKSSPHPAEGSTEK